MCVCVCVKLWYSETFFYVSDFKATQRKIKEEHQSSEGLSALVTDIHSLTHHFPSGASWSFISSGVSDVQGESISEFSKEPADNSTNYCSLQNLMDGEYLIR